MPDILQTEPDIAAAFRVPSKASRTAAIVRDAINQGKPLPLAVMLETMWNCRDKALLYEANGPEYDPLRAREYRISALQAAVQAAPYIHPKLSNVTVRPEDEMEAAERREIATATRAALQGKGIKELGAMWLSVTRGEVVDVTPDRAEPPAVCPPDARQEGKGE